MISKLRFTSVALLLVACGGGDSKAPPPPAFPDGGGLQPPPKHDDAGTGARGSTGGATGAGGSSAEAGTDAASDAAVPIDAPAPPLDATPADVNYDALAPGPSVCSPSVHWSTGTRLGFSASARLLAITPDEKTVVWSQTTGTTAVYYVADRASPSAAFDAPVAIAPFANLDPSQGLAIASDGLTIVGVRATHTGFSQITRSSAQDPFHGSGRIPLPPPVVPVVDAGPPPALDGSVSDAAVRDAAPPDAGRIAESDATIEVADETPLASLNLFAEQFGEHDRAPVLSFDGASLYYNGDEVGAGTVKVAHLDASSRWGNAEVLSGDLLSSTGPAWKLPTGISTDGLTLFYFDLSNATESVAFRTVTGVPFDTVVALGAYPDAKPTAACSALYFTQGTDIARTAAD
jgi:hypothetical protein